MRGFRAIALLAALALAVPSSLAVATPLGPDQNPAAGVTLVNPEIDCNGDPLGGTGNVAGIIIDDPNVTVINPEIRECIHGIRVTTKNGVMPTGVRVVADAAYPGYTETNFTLNRYGIIINRGNGEIGDVSVPADSVGGEFEFIDNFRPFTVHGTSSLHMHHTTSTCTIPCPTYSGADSPGAHWGLKGIADRTLGAPYEISNVQWDHNVVQGFDDEGISLDPRNQPGDVRGAKVTNGTVSKVTPSQDKLSLKSLTHPISGVVPGMFVIFDEGPKQGESLRITARSGNTLTLADPINVLGGVRVGDRVAVGMRFHNNDILSNEIDAFHHTAAKSGVSIAAGLLTHIADNRIFDTPSFPFPDSFHLRSDHQCVMVKHRAGPDGITNYSHDSAVVGNSCESSGDISAALTSFGSYEVDSPVWISGNTFSGSPLGEVHRYKAPQPATDPTG